MEQAIESPIWRRRWFQVMVAVLVGCGIAAFILPPIFALIYATRSVLVPVLIALALAYVFNPVVTWLDRRGRMPRWLGTATVMLTAAAIVAVVVLLIVPPMIEQAGSLLQKIRHEYPQSLLAQIEGAMPVRDATPPTGEAAIAADATPLDAPEPDDVDWWQRLVDPDRTEAWIAKANEALAEVDWRQVYQFVISSLDIGVGFAGAAIGFTGYLVVAAVVVSFCFFFFSWKFSAFWAWFVPFIPLRHRARTLEIVGKMDRSVAAFIRGRLIQAAMMAVLLSIGWAIAGVPGFLLLGLACGALNLIPYAAVLGFVAALGLNVIDDTSAGTFTWWTVLGPTLVYAAAQLLDGWVVEPIVQGKATDLDPVTVLLAVMLGAATAGLLGMLLAIPIAACIKILAREVVLPRLRALATATA